MADKQQQLNGAFHGPAIPSTRTYNRPGRRSNCGCCCFLTLLLKIIISIIVIIGIALFIFWLVVRPNKVKFHLSHIRLNEFNTTNTTRDYDLVANITVRNPNRRIKIYYDSFEARTIYENRILGSKYMPKFLQGHKSTNVFSAHSKGNGTSYLTPPEVEFYNMEKANGIYNFKLDMYLRVRLRLGDIITGSFKPIVKCDFKVSSSDGRLAGGDETVKCHVASYRFF